MLMFFLCGFERSDAFAFALVVSTRKTWSCSPVCTGVDDGGCQEKKLEKTNKPTVYDAEEFVMILHIVKVLEGGGKNGQKFIFEYE